jgi:DNA/RNA-binding domain of Phe-tRNA-synthetase-like protein
VSFEEADLAPAAGAIAAELAAEFPGLRLDWVTAPGGRGQSPAPVRARLAALSSRMRGAGVVAMRTQPVIHAYRSFFRQIGLDPDVDRVPAEAAAVARLLQGGLRSVDRVEDARLVAVVETGVPVWAVDADAVAPGGLGLRSSQPGEVISPLRALPPGSLVVADAERVQAELFGDVRDDALPTSRTRAVVLFSIGVEGVPAIHVEEALWLCLELLEAW